MIIGLDFFPTIFCLKHLKKKCWPLFTQGVFKGVWGSDPLSLGLLHLTRTWSNLSRVYFSTIKLNLKEVNIIIIKNKASSYCSLWAIIYYSIIPTKHFNLFFMIVRTYRFQKTWGLFHLFYFVYCDFEIVCTLQFENLLGH